MDRPPLRPDPDQARWRDAEAKVRAAARSLAARPHPWFALLAPLLLFPGMWACAAQASTASGAAKVPWILTGGVLYMWMAIVGHDCTHGAFSHDPRGNRWMGTLVLAHGLGSFEAYRALHVAHHLNTGFDTDPSGDSPEVQAGSNLLTHVFFVLLPLGFPVFQLLPGWLAAVHLEPRPYPACVRARIRRDFVFVLALHSALLASLGPVVWLHYTPILLLGTFLIIQLFGFNHVFTEAYTDVCSLNTRNIETAPPVQWLTMNAGLHVEHHIAPDVPWYRLPALRALLHREAGPPPYSVRGFLRAHAQVLAAHARAAFGPRPPLA